MRLDFLSLINRNKKIVDRAMMEAKAAKDQAELANTTAKQAEASALNAAQSANSVMADIDQIRNSQEMPGAPGKSVELRMSPDQTGAFQIRREGGSEADWLTIQVKGEPGSPAVVNAADIQAVIDSNPLRFQGPAPSNEAIAQTISDYLQSHVDQFKGDPGEPGKNPSEEVLTGLVKNVIAANPDQFKGPKGELPSDNVITDLVKNIINANPDQFKGPKGDPPSDSSVTTLIQNTINANPDRFKGVKGDLGASPYVTYVTTASTGLTTVNFPTGRFSKVPRIMVQPYSPSGDAFTYWGEVLETTSGTVSPSVTSCTIRIRRQTTGVVSSLVNLLMNEEPKKAINVVVVAYDQ